MRFGTWNYVREIKQTGEVYIKEMIVLKQGRDFYAFTDFNKYITGNNKKRSQAAGWQRRSVGCSGCGRWRESRRGSLP